MPTSQKHRRSPFAALLGGLLVVVTMLALAPAAAAAPHATLQDGGDGNGDGGEADQSFTGRLQAGGEPVQDVAIAVVDPAGEPVGDTTTDADGAWEIPVEERTNGDYTITIDPATLPDDVTLADPGSTTRTLALRPGVEQFVAFGLTSSGDAAEGGGRPATRFEGPTFVDKLGERGVNGVKYGLIIAMAAIGLSLIFGTTGLINFAHGELVTFGAVAAWFLSVEGPELALIGAGAVAVLLGAIVGGTLEVGLWRPLRARKVGLFQMLVISIGLSLAARQILLIWFGGSSRPYREYLIQERLELGPLSATPRDLTVMVLSVLALVGVAALLQRTRAGKAMRAVADNVDLAESSGIDVRRVLLTVWVVGAGLAALGGVFFGVVETVNWDMGFRLLLLMFAAMILGGLGNAYGGMVGGLVIGLVTEISTIWLSTELKYVWALLVLIVVLLLKPDGILGVKERIG
ncbi:hypothetical protein BH20ACT2_BH20ACT2_12780 [soil metagenome]